MICEHYLFAFQVSVTTVRVIAILIIFSLVLLFFGNKKFVLTKNTKTLGLLYLLFTFYAILVSFVNGDYVGTNYFQYFGSRMGFIFMLIFILPSLCPNEKTLYKAAHFFLLLNAVNAAFVILQYFKIDMFWNILDIINVNVTYIGDGKYYYQVPQKWPPTVPPGLNGFIVTTGYFLLAALPLVFIYFKKNKILFSALSVLFLYSILLTVQRSAILLSVIAYVFLLLTFMNRRQMMYLGLAMLASTFFFADFWIDMIFGFIKENPKLNNLTSDLVRVYYYEKSIEFILANPLFGGVDKYYMVTKPFSKTIGIFSPHNLILNAMLKGGIIMLLIVLAMVYKTFKLTWDAKRKFAKNLNIANVYIFLFYFSASLTILNSLFHNAGFTTGFSLFWWYFLIGDRFKLYAK